MGQGEPRRQERENSDIRSAAVAQLRRNPVNGPSGPGEQPGHAKPGHENLCHFGARYLRKPPEEMNMERLHRGFETSGEMLMDPREKIKFIPVDVPRPTQDHEK